MKRIGKLCACVLIISVLNLQAPLVAFAAEGAVPAKSDTITKNPPEMVASPELNIPGGKAEGKTSYTWLWWVLGAVVVGVAAAAGGGGGGGGSSGGGSGSVSVGW
jgi:hypothetical protein